MVTYPFYLSIILIFGDPSGRMGNVDFKKASEEARKGVDMIKELIESTPENERKTIIFSDGERPCN